ncbi:hypothetical protein ACTFBY_23170, partial [Aeromonas dhakensis]
HFLRASLPAALLYLLFGQLQTSPAAIGYALASGALASGLGYALWYLVLPHLGRTLPPASSCSPWRAWWYCCCPASARRIAGAA